MQLTRIFMVTDVAPSTAPASPRREAPAFAGILFTHDPMLILSILLFGFLLWSSFAATISMVHELVPTQIGLILGHFMGIAMGAGGIGGSIPGVITDHFGLTATLATFT